MRSHLFHHHLHRRVVQRQVVAQQSQQPPPPSLIVPAESSHQRRSSHIQPVAPRIHPPSHLLLRRPLSLPSCQPHFLLLQPRLPPYHLHRLPQPFPHHPCPQYVMSLDHSIQRSHKPLQPLRALETQQRRQQIRIPLPHPQVLKQNPFLQRRQRIYVLHIPRSSCHSLHDPLDLLLLQLHQRQHLR